MMKLKILAFISLIFITVFIFSGYMLSDDKYFNDLIKENHIDTPERAFQYVSENIEFSRDLSITSKVAGTMTPRYMLQRKYMWCDQGAMILATIVHELGYETRLVDIGAVDDPETFGHTFLQIYQNGEWKNYDTVLKKGNITQKQLLEGFSQPPFNIKNLPEQNVYTRLRSYPNWYNWVIQNNFYIKHLALWLRGGPG